MVGSTGINLYNLTVGTLNAKEIPLATLVGFDGASNIMEQPNSFIGRLGNIIVFRCIRHSIYLFASESIKDLPCDCDVYIRNIDLITSFGILPHF